MMSLRKKWVGLFAAAAVCVLVAAAPVCAAEDRTETIQDELSTGETVEDVKNTASGNETGEVDIIDAGNGSGENAGGSAGIAVSGVKLDVTELSFSEITGKQALTAIVEPSDAANQNVIWSSDDTSVAKVTDDGIVTPVANGTTVIRVTTEDGDQTAECQVTVNLYNGVCKSTDGNWYYYINGVIQKNHTGIDKNANGWWYVKNGQVAFGYYGFAQNSKGWWYVENGAITQKRTDVIKGTVNGESAWWYVKNSKVTVTNTVAQNSKGWWRIVDGKVDFTCNSVEKNENGWWYISKGKVDFTFTGVAKNAKGWWYCKNGKVNFNYTGFAQNTKGWWYVEKGQVTLKKTDVIKGTVNGESAWWYVKNSKVTAANTVAQNTKGWWYIKNGKVDFTYTGVAQNTKGWWRIVKGKVDFTYTGLAQNSKGWWYCKSGKVDFTYTGIAQNSNGYWYVKNGKLASDYNGTVTYDNKTWKVVNGKATASESIKYVKVTDSSSPLYGKTLKLYYDKNGNLLQDVTGKYTGSRTYEIYINKTKNMVTVYTKDGDYYVPVKCFVCSTGGSNTPNGTYYTPAKYRWHELMGPCWGQWCTRITTNGVLFHSVFYNSYNNNNALSVSAYNKLGTTASHGCVRLTAGDAKWIYDNCALKTKVVIYSSSGYEPLTKPSAYKLSSSHTWDPTDPNMYYKCQQRGCH